MKRKKKQKNKNVKSDKVFDKNSEINKRTDSAIDSETPTLTDKQDGSPDETESETTPDISETPSENISDNPSGEVSENISESINNDISESSSENISDSLSGSIVDVSEHISGSVSERVNDDTSTDASTMPLDIDFLEPDEYHKTKGTTIFVDPDDMLKKQLRISDTTSPEPAEEFGTKQLKPDWFLSPDELSGEKKTPVEEVKEYRTERIEAVSPVDLKDEPQDEISDEFADEFSADFSSDMSEEQIKTEALSLEDMPDPFDLISPDEFLPEETHFVSRALKSGTVILGKYKIVKKISEKRDHNSYLVKDIIEDGRKYILHEIIPPEMDQEELRKRRYKFGDNVRLLMTFKHEYLGTVYEHFTENQREYYVMEYVDGLSFSRLSKMNVKAFSEKEVRKWGADLCKVLTFLHDRPNPFTLGEFDPDDIMIDQNGNIKIITYNLHRFFDVERTLEFMPDNPKELYDEITMLSRFLYYLLTKDEYVDDETNPPEYPENTSAKMMKLMTVSCKTGQQSIGYIGTFEKKLEDTENPETQDNFYEMWKTNRWGVNRGISFIGRLTGALLGQNPFLIALEIVLIIFLLMMGTFQKIEQSSGFVKPDGVSMLYVAGGNSLLTYRQDDLKLIDENELGSAVSDLVSSKISFSEYKDYKTVSITTNALIAAMKHSSSLRILDEKNHSLLTTLTVDKDPEKLEIDRDNNILLVMHKEPSTISVINLKSLKLQRLLLTGLNPADMTILRKINVSDEEIKLRLRNFERREKAKQNEDSGFPGISKPEPVKTSGAEDSESENPEDRERGKESEAPVESGIGLKFQDEDKTEDKTADIGSFIDEISPKEIEKTETPTVNEEFSGAGKREATTETPKAAEEKILAAKKWYKEKNTIVAVVNQGSKDVMIMDTQTGQILSRILIDGIPSSVIQSVEGNMLYVLDRTSNKIIVIDLVISRVLREIPISMSNTVTSFALDKNRNRLWLSLSEENSLVYYDPETGKFSETYPLIGNNPVKLYMENEQGILWIINDRSRNLVRFDCKNDKVLDKIEIHKEIRSIYIENMNSEQATGSK